MLRKYKYKLTSMLYQYLFEIEEVLLTDSVILNHNYIL